MNPCQQVKYIDCRSWYDLGEQCLATCMAVYFMLRVARHYRELSREKEDDGNSEYQKSVRRKMGVDVMLMGYLGVFLGSTLFNIYLFFPYRGDLGYFQDEVPQKWYKISEILFINWLNGLNLTVGFLYWKGARTYYVVSNLQIPFLFRRLWKFFFVLVFAINALAIIIAILFLILLKQMQDKPAKITTLVSTIISIVVCISCRALYRQHILAKLDMSPRALRTQLQRSVFLIFSSLCRIVLYSVDIGVDYEWQERIRNEEVTDTGCLDTWPAYAFILFSINFVVNLLPAYTYTRLFVSEVDGKLKKSKSQRLLRKQSEDS